MQAWGDRVIAGLRPKVKALFQAGRFVGVDGEKALFGLPNETHRVRCEEIRGEVESALTEYFGRPVRLSLVVDTADAAVEPDIGSPSPPSPASARRGASRSRPSGARTAGPSPAAPEEEGPDGSEELSAFDEAEMGEVADIDNSVESRVRQAFPGAEEVS